MKSVENILGYISAPLSLEQIFEIAQENTLKFSKLILGNKKLNLNQNVWHDHATIQQDILVHFWVIFLYWNNWDLKTYRNKLEKVEISYF